MPAIKLQTYAQMIGNLSYSGVEYAKESRFVPDIAKTKLDESRALVMKYNDSHVDPLLTVADERLEKALVKTKDVYGDLAAKYAEGGIKKVAVETYPIVVDNVVTPVAQEVAARTEVSRERVKSLWNSSQRTKERVMAKAFDQADAVKSFTQERAQQIVHTDLIAYAKQMENAYVEPAREAGRQAVDKSVRYVREADLQKLREDLSFLAAEAQRLSHEKLSLAVDKVDSALKAGRASAMERYNNTRSAGLEKTSAIMAVVSDFPALQARGQELVVVVKEVGMERYAQVMQRLDALFHGGAPAEVPAAPAPEVMPKEVHTVEETNEEEEATKEDEPNKEEDRASEVSANEVFEDASEQ